MDEKKWFLSKTLWVNVLGVIAIIMQSVTNSNILPPENQAALLGMINVILRFLTKAPVVWK